MEDQPFPHTLPGNDTAYYNDVGNHTGAGYDGPGECLSHVFNHGERLYPAPKSADNTMAKYWMRINVSEFVLEKDRCVVQTSNSGHELLVQPAYWCPIFALPDHAGSRP